MPTELIIALALYFTLISLLSSLKPRYIPGRAIYLFRVFFPSWRFYEDICEMPMLYYRSVEPKGEWRAAWQKPERTWSTLLINPRVNYLLACQGLLNQVENDVNELGEAEHQEFSSSVSYRLLDKLVRYSMREQGEEAVLRYQFKLMVASGGVANPETSTQVASEARFEDVLISPVMERDSVGVSK